MAGEITWDQANFSLDSNSFTWDDVKLARRAAGEDWNTWKKEDKKKLIKLVLKVHGNTITESKQKEIKQYKITAKDIKIVVKEVLGVKMIAEGISI
ncbi:hypothetical protein [uncultured virus]|uniref:Uncharacterized protein n=1 Tax=uncultured virus TaxID=340016 RepID=A0A218ML67_9VIRU|nr:hypothetical protein [uncultured virus]|tara:strand:+ start:3068 stop:3355 length:288 start_codon:yes stop_codon:yes gene_type:complete